MAVPTEYLAFSPNQCDESLCTAVTHSPQNKNAWVSTQLSYTSRTTSHPDGDGTLFRWRMWVLPVAAAAKTRAPAAISKMLYNV